jgi:hypothetical protein
MGKLFLTMGSLLRLSAIKNEADIFGLKLLRSRFTLIELAKGTAISNGMHWHPHCSRAAFRLFSSFPEP